jgi:ribosomal protein S18 acetylase RimI-like enzyme
MIRPASPNDRHAIWTILEPMLRAGDTYSLPSQMPESEALAYWQAPGHSVFVVEDQSRVVGTYFLRTNQQGGGSHVANCGYVSHPDHRGRGIAREMCTHSLEAARARGFLAMQFNFVVSTNEGAIRLWQHMGFDIVGRLPKAFKHPRLGYVDALVMYRQL